MATITALNVRLGMDASNFSAGADLARTEVNRVAAVMRQSVPPAEKFRKDVELLNKAFSESGRKTADYANAVEHLRKKHQQGQYSAEAIAAAQKKEADARHLAAESLKRQRGATDKLKQGIANLAKEEQSHDALLRRQTESLRGIKSETDKVATSNSALVSRIKMLAAAYISFQGAKTGIKIASDMEQASIAFEVLTGSAEKGKKTFDDLRKFAASTPITLEGAQQAARTLLTFDRNAKNIIPTLQAIGNLAQGNNDRFTRLTYAFAKTMSSGRLLGDEVLQMADAGFNPLVEMSERLNISMPELRKQMERGAISADMVKQSFMNVGGEGGRLGSMMDRMGKTAAGAYSQMISSIQELVAQVGSHLLPILASAAKSMESVVRATSGLISLFDRSQVQLIAMVGAFSATVFILPKVIAGIKGVVAVLQLMTKTQAIALAFTGPKGWAILAAGAAAAALAVKQVDKAFDGMAASAEAAMGGDDKGKKTEAAAKAAAAAMAGVQRQVSPLEKEFLTMEHSLNEQVKLANLGEDAYRRQSLYIKGMSIEQVQRIEELHNELKMADRIAKREKEMADARRKQAEDRKKQLEDIEAAFTKDIEQAMNAAKQYFEQERQRDNERRKAVSQGPSSIEFGSAEAAKFRADQINQRIGAAAVPVKATPGEKEIADKTRELLIEQRKNNAAQEKELETMKLLLVQFKENGFRRVR